MLIKVVSILLFGVPSECDAHRNFIETKDTAVAEFPDPNLEPDVGELGECIFLLLRMSRDVLNLSRGRLSVSGGPLCRRKHR